MFRRDDALALARTSRPVRVELELLKSLKAGRVGVRSL